MKNKIITFGFFFVVFQFAFSQTSGIAADVDSTSTITAIPISDISFKSEEALNSISSYIEKIQPDQSITEITDNIQLMVDSIRLEKKAFKKESVEDFSKRRLENKAITWNNYKKSFAVWEKVLLDEVHKLQEIDEEIKLLRLKWDLTKKNALEANAPGVTLNRISLIAKEINKFISELIKINKKYLTLQDKIAGQINITNSVLKTIEKYQGELRNEYWSIDDVPIWNSPFFISDDKEKLSIIKAVDSDLKILMEYLQNNVGQIVLLIIIFTILFLFIQYFKRQDIAHIIEGTDEIYLHLTGVILKKPFSAAIMVTFFILVFSNFNMPAIMVEIITILITIPIVRLIPGFVDPKLWKSYFILISLFVLIQIDSYFAEYLLISQRYILLFEALIALYMLYSFYRKRELLMSSSFSWGRQIVPRIIPVAILFIIVSIIGNIMGMSFLAENMVVGTVKSSMYLLMLFMIYLIINGFISILMRRQQAHAFQALKKRTKIVEKQIMIIFGLIISYIWIRGVLKAFFIYEMVEEGVVSFVSYNWMFGSFSVSISSILGFIIVVAITFFISRFISLILEEDIFARIKFPRGVAGAISMMSRYIIVGIGIIVALAVAGFDMSKFSLIIGALGVGIGFGLQNIINNFVSGLILAFERPIQAGDVIEVGKNLGTVRQIGVRASRIRSFDGTEVIIPNADLISKDVINWTLSDKLKRQEIFIKVAIDSNPHLVKDILEKVCEDHAYVLDEPRPLILYLGFSEYSLDFRMLFWTYADNGLSTKSEVGLKVYDELQKAGVRIPVPSREVNIKNQADAKTATASKSRPKKK